MVQLEKGKQTSFLRPNTGRESSTYWDIIHNDLQYSEYCSKVIWYNTNRIKQITSSDTKLWYQQTEMQKCCYYIGNYRNIKSIFWNLTLFNFKRVFFCNPVQSKFIGPIQTGDFILALQYNCSTLGNLPLVPQKCWQCKWYFILFYQLPWTLGTFNPNLPDPFWGCSVSIWSQRHLWRLK